MKTNDASSASHTRLSSPTPLASPDTLHTTIRPPARRAILNTDHQRHDELIIKPPNPKWWLFGT
ncbi:hypothetical protein E2C01_042496 [Portunus trituberculatus]|uniref:Uncharacterized protein n=1 Tax=Portunus trituberculatus TaxID=210409 RepID=A0A5B7FWN3_PORTR|nr:hypothetical protein [Portunus trituberculatus]